jgi:putative acyl-CoA dehydrogenase
MGPRATRGRIDPANQPPPLQDYNLFDQDVVLREAVDREAGDWGLQRLSAFGGIAGGEALRLGPIADRNPPALRSYDRYGNRIDEIEFHPAWTELLRLGIVARSTTGRARGPRRSPDAADPGGGRRRLSLVHDVRLDPGAPAGASAR